MEGMQMAGDEVREVAGAQPREHGSSGKDGGIYREVDEKAHLVDSLQCPSGCC